MEVCKKYINLSLYFYFKVDCFVFLAAAVAVVHRKFMKFNLPEKKTFLSHLVSSLCQWHVTSQINNTLQLPIRQRTILFFSFLSLILSFAEDNKDNQI